eukprot:15624324-Heterocapsa_arctica.AAC.1
MLKAKQIQSHKRINPNKSKQTHAEEYYQAEDRLDEEPIDKSDTEYISCVMKNIRIYQNSIDQTDDRDRHEERQQVERAKALEETENQISNKIDTHDDIQQTEREDRQTEVFQQSKKHNTEDTQAVQSNVLTMQRKRKEDQYHYRNVQTTKKVK